MFPLRLKFVCLLVTAVASLGGFAWYYHATARQQSEPAPPPATLHEGVVAATRQPIPEAAADFSLPPEPAPPARADPAEVEDVETAIRRNCPWPPTPSAWETLDRRCLSAMERRGANDQWRFTFAVDPFETRRAVVAALDDPRCHIPAGEIRADLQEACAADAMVRLAALQMRCVYYLHWNPDDTYARGRQRLVQIAADALTQDEYYAEAAKQDMRAANSLWRFHVCRSVAGAVDWVDAIPPPLFPLGEAERRHRRGNPLPETQYDDLREAARRLGYPYSPKELEALDFALENGYVRLDDPNATPLRESQPGPESGTY